MTKRERAQVVELLRCAADAEPLCLSTWVGIWGAACRLGHVRSGLGNDTYKIATIARMHVSMPGADFRTLSLEAAQRVEEGTWP